MQPADVLYNMTQAALKKNDRTFQAFQKSMGERKAQQEAFYAEVAAKNARKPSAEELKAEEDARKAEAMWNETGKFVPVGSEEPASEEPVKRVVREDADARAVALAQDDEEAEEPVARRVRPEGDDEGWGASARKFGNYGEDGA